MCRKYLKAYLQEHQINFERKHDLIPLLAMCISLDEELQSLKEGLQELDRCAVVVRYPGIIIKAESALKSAVAIRKFRRRKLK